MTLRRRSFFLQPCTILRCTKGSNGGTPGKANFPIRRCATRWCREPQPTFVPNAHVPPRSSVHKELRRKFAGSQACRMRRQRVSRRMGRPNTTNSILDGKRGDKNFTWVAEKFFVAGCATLGDGGQPLFPCPPGMPPPTGPPK